MAARVPHPRRVRTLIYRPCACALSFPRARAYVLSFPYYGMIHVRVRRRETQRAREMVIQRCPAPVRSVAVLGLLLLILHGFFQTKRLETVKGGNLLWIRCAHPILENFTQDKSELDTEGKRCKYHYCSAVKQQHCQGSTIAIL